VIELLLRASGLLYLQECVLWAAYCYCYHLSFSLSTNFCSQLTTPFPSLPLPTFCCLPLVPPSYRSVIILRCVSRRFGKTIAMLSMLAWHEGQILCSIRLKSICVFWWRVAKIRRMNARELSSYPVFGCVSL
jgi:hypothetical protein